MSDIRTKKQEKKIVYGIDKQEKRRNLWEKKNIWTRKQMR